MNPEIVEVTMSDRMAAWPFRERKSDGPSSERWGSGFYDSIPIIQAFARHRIAALTAARSAIMEEAAGIAEDEIYEDVPNSETWTHNEACRTIATAIRAAGVK